MDLGIAIGCILFSNTLITRNNVTEGSLEVKLPTIWTDGRAEVGRVREEKRRRKKIREEERRRKKIREEKESEERRCRCAKRFIHSIAMNHLGGEVWQCAPAWKNIFGAA